MILSRRSVLLAGALALALSGCERQQSAPPPAIEAPPLQIVDPAMDSRTQGAWLHAVGVLDASLQHARDLSKTVDGLLTEPTEANLQAARLAWHRTHDSYLEFELYSALSGSNPGLFGLLLEHDFAIEAWPIQPGYLDYFDVYTHSGIVNDAAMPLTAEALRDQHGFTDSSDVSLGFHAIEYLLWGEKGTRPVGDFAQAVLADEQTAAGVRTVDLPGNRRRALITLLSSLLIDDLEALKQQVEDPTGLLRRSYFTLQPPSRVRLLRSAGMILLSHHRDMLQAQIDGQALAGEAGEAAEEVAASGGSDSLRHNPFAGSAAISLAHSLSGVDSVLLSSESGIGQWLADNPEQWQPAIAEFASLRQELLAWNDQPWPPTKEKGEQMVATLSQLAELLAQDDQ
jgi:putative iron-regulated protein